MRRALLAGLLALPAAAPAAPPPAAAFRRGPAPGAAAARAVRPAAAVLARPPAAALPRLPPAAVPSFRDPTPRRKAPGQDAPRALASLSAFARARAAAPRRDPSAALGTLWLGASSAEEAEAGEEPARLTVRGPRARKAVEAALALAMGTSSGRRILLEARRLLGAKSLPVDVLDLKNNLGEFDYLEGRLRLHRKLLAPEARVQLASTLVHELRHAAQHARGLPADALELEVEAHLDDLALLEELGETPAPGSFARALRGSLSRGPEAFLARLRDALPGSIFLPGSSVEEARDQLEEDMEEVERGRSPRSRRRAARLRRDFLWLGTPEGAQAYREFSERVMRRLRRACAQAAG